MTRSVMVILVSMLLLAGCSIGAGGKMGVGNPFAGGGSSYAMIKQDLENGRIMQAREKVLALDKTHADYERAHKLLDAKIEPARRRIFVHYLRLAREYEKSSSWSEAMSAYEQARTVTIKPEEMEQKRAEMEHLLRQLRFDKLIEQRRLEDHTLLSYAPAYVPAKGIDPSDEVYLRQQEQYNESLDDRAERAYRESRRYLRNKQYGPAYVEIESHMRLQPDSSRGEKLLEAVKRDMPAWLQVPQLQTVSAKTAQAEKRMTAPKKEVTLQDVQDAVKKEELTTAKHLAQLYRRNGGKGADSLLGQIQNKLDARSDALFAKGSAAFRQEQLDDAIRYWSEAVALTPEKTEYVEALNRAKQLKERLNLLRSQKDSDPIPQEE